jgi:hypothetical protein
MRLANRFRTLALGLTIAATFAAGSASLYSQSGQSTAPSITPSANEAPEHNWTDAQLITSTVSEAWRLSGRNEETFFDMVQQLAAISAKNRGLVLPENAAAGRRAGLYIKRMAKADHQQLLYVVVDEAVRKVGTPAPANK